MKLQGMPLVGAFFKGADGGSTSSEFVLLSSLVGVVTVQGKDMTMPLGIALAGVGLGVGLFALARAMAKAGKPAAEPEAKPVEPASKPVAAVVAFILGFGLLAGCSALSVDAQYKDTIRRVGEVGPRIAGDIKPTDAGGEARKQAFLDLVEECQRVSR